MRVETVRIFGGTPKYSRMLNLLITYVRVAHVP